MLHGGGSLFFEKLSRVTFSIRGALSVPMPSLHGTLVTHSLVHASLFGFFALSQHAIHTHIFPQFHRKDEELFGDQEQRELLPPGAERYIASFASGTAAGALSEVVGYYIRGLEERGLLGAARVRMNEIKKMPLPSARMVAFAAVPSGIGFLASEAARLVGEEKHRL